jgi:cytoskeletal protein RodZ
LAETAVDSLRTAFDKQQRYISELERMTETDEFEGRPTVGEQLRAAREAKKVNLEDIAAQTRIPQRHLESLERSDWEHLPAPTYTIGFAKSYASALGLDRTEIGEQLRTELGGQRLETATMEVFEPADPKRTMPKSLVFGALGAIILLVVVMSWLSNRSLEGDDAAAPAETAATSSPAMPSSPAPAPAAATPAQGPVVLTAVAPAWIRVTDGGKTLFEGVLSPGQTFAVPTTATAPLLRAGAPEALRINVGSATAPPVGPAGVVTSNVSLLPADLMRAGPSTGAATTPAPSAPPGVQNTAG